MWPDDDDLTPLGQAYAWFKIAIEHVAMHDPALDRRERDVCRSLDLALSTLDDLYGGDDAMLIPFAAYARATDHERRLARDIFTKLVELEQQLATHAAGSGMFEFARATTRALLDVMLCFVSPVDSAVRRGALVARAG